MGASNDLTEYCSNAIEGPDACCIVQFTSPNLYKVRNSSKRSNSLDLNVSVT